MIKQPCIPLTDIRKPRIYLRPIRRSSLEYAELVESIKNDGVLQPILLRPTHCVGCSQDACVGDACTAKKTQNEYEPVEGNHRYEASIEAGCFDIPAVIKEMSDDEVLVFQLKCQAIRPETFSFEYARRLKLLMERGATLNELSRKTGKNPKWIRDQIQLNRLCEEARSPVENGKIAVKSALALANLPTNIQKSYVEEAIKLEPDDFVTVAKAAKRDYDAFILNERTDNRRMGVAQPVLRTVNALKNESLEPKHADAVLKAMGATTPRDGWLACLAWAFKLDPLTISGKLSRKEEAFANEVVYRQMNREMIRKFVKPQIRKRPE